MNANTLDEKAKSLATTYIRTEAALLCVLLEMSRTRAFAVLGFSGVFQYCEQQLKLSESQSYYFKAVVEKSQKVPQMKEAVVQGEISFSMARRIAPVITQENHREWIEKAKTLPQRELEKEVSLANPNPKVREKIRVVAKEVSELKVPIDSKTEENLKVLREVLSQKRNKAVTFSKVIAWVVEMAREKEDPIRKAERAKKISSTRKTAVVQGRRTAVPSGIKHQVVLRDRNQCTYQSPEGRRCEQRRWLHAHHVREVQHGGEHTVSNLKLLCSQHHKMMHNLSTVRD